MKATNKKSNSFRKPLLISLGLHVILFVALIWGADFTMSEPKPTGQMVQAVVIDPQLVRQQAQQIRQQREAASKKEQERLDKLRRESERLEKNRKAEEENIRKLKEQQAKEAKATREAEKRRVEKEKQRQAEEARLQQEKKKAAKAEADRKLKEAALVKAENERKAKEAAIAKAEQERVAKEKAAQEAAEKARKEKEAAERAEKQRIAKEKEAAAAAEKARKAKEAAARAEKERKQQEAALNDIFAGLETEATQNSSARQQFISDEAQRYGAIYTQLIQQNLLLEDSYRGRSCRVNLKLIPTGSNAILGSLSILDGDSRLCAATKRAVAQVQSYPLPKDPDIVKSLKDINLTVSPE
ncbi:cell division and transport-associated protein TolA [Vibrio crassostreae]|uniref:cell envelope integrity protein TolA n=1 Tax=Vibrio crassostreae TaxID=246167 RepID=UPI000F4A37DC|nr:cell envelope integrity protein TolA [Vibrio crassostreae]NOH73910.1 cell envelope integrity protein TolA [Vibrio crassostreae]ROR16724.1 cell division and transport-associated protein TolA [Vibrio crassostreae]TCN80072.1 cell division and transport-associated protein TolA [Vibrio crassostreae]TWD73969.1 cell division and transport-associated protein TolA [Vibrio crassostreae]CAK2043395.1 colicin import membrane protein [Vibrio crassostreae]